MILGTPTVNAIQTHATLEPLKVMILTWNVNAKIEQKSEIRSLFFSEGDTKADFPEIVAVGLQEVVELSTSNVVGSAIAGQGRDRAGKWQEMILEMFQAEGLQFDVVASVDLVGLWIAVFAAHKIRPCISKVQVSTLSRGVGNILGNKGAVYARMDILDTSVCFVNAHFAAHREQVQKRNEDFHAIFTTNVFPDYLSTNIDLVTSSTTKYGQMVQLNSRIAELKKSIATYDVVRNGSLSRSNSCNRAPGAKTGTTELPRHCADDHDIVLWFGDLNYRIVTGLETSIVYDMIESKRSIYLAPYDQLNQERESGRVFNHFHEGLLTFEPTYQYIPGKDCYDNRKDKKLRCPAWCDRVLWRIGKHSATEKEVYEAVNNATTGGGASGMSTSRSNANLQDADSDAEDESVVSSIAMPTLPVLTPTPNVLEIEANLNSELSSPQPIKDKIVTFGTAEREDESELGNNYNRRVMEEFDCQETVELMYYNRCNNVISDHKPVRAVLNVKIKKVDWAASELSLIEEYKQNCPITNPLNDFINQLQPINFSAREPSSFPYMENPVTVTPRSTKFYSLVSSGPAVFSNQTSLTSVDAPSSTTTSLPTSPLTSPLTSSITSPTSSASRTNHTQVRLKNNLTQCGVVYSILPSSVPNWLVLSSLRGVIDKNESLMLEMTTNQAEINNRARVVQDQYKIYNDLTTLGRYIVNNHNFNSHSVELYAMLEIELSVYLPSIATTATANNSNSSSGSAGLKLDGAPRIDIPSGAVMYSGEPAVFTTLHVPVICCAEHSVPPLTVMSQLTAV